MASHMLFSRCSPSANGPTKPTIPHMCDGLPTCRSLFGLGCCKPEERGEMECVVSRPAKTAFVEKTLVEREMGIDHRVESERRESAMPGLRAECPSTSRVRQERVERIG